jgi:predicted site-specific integrase-resolvase
MPRLVGEMEAAKTIGLELATFRTWVESGRLPPPLPDCGKFDLKALDAAVDRISGLGNPANALDMWRAKGQRNASTA